MPKGGARRGAGRKRKAPRLKVLEGNPGKRPIEPGLELPPGAPPEPHWPSVLPGKRAKALRREAQREWRRVVPELDRAGVLAHVDHGLLADYCAAHAELVECRRALARHGPTVEVTVVRKNGDEVTSTARNPLAVTVRELRSGLNTYRSELGLGPASRAKLNIGGGDGESDAERRVFGD